MEREAAAPLVELSNVRKAFGDNVVLNDVDLRIAAGEAIVVAGPSGSGKSTMLRCINGLETIDAGTISFAGRRIGRSGRELSALRTEIGMVAAVQDRDIVSSTREPVHDFTADERRSPDHEDSHRTILE